jgi:hypothetical protein
MTPPCRMQDIAAKLWNEAKPAQNGKPTSSKKARTRRA